MTTKLKWPQVDAEVLGTLSPVLRGVVKALGFVRAREFLSEHGGINHNIPMYRTTTLGLESDELLRLRTALEPHMDAAGRVWLPKPDKLFIMVRNAQIRRDRSKMSINTLAKRNQLSSRHIVNICQETDDRQGDLF